MKREYGFCMKHGSFYEKDHRLDNSLYVEMTRQQPSLSWNQILAS